VSTVEARRRSLAGQSHLDPVVHRATRGPTSPTTSSYVPLRDPYTLQRLYHPTNLSHPPSRRYTGSCDPRRGKLSTLAPHQREEERASYVTSDICGLFDRQTALSPSFKLLSRGASFFSLSPSSVTVYLDERRGKQIMTIAKNVSIPTENGTHSYEKTVKSFIRYRYQKSQCFDISLCERYNKC